MLESSLVAARQQRPYYSRAISALTPRAVDGLGTCAVDRYWRLYIDCEWFGRFAVEQRGAIIAQHEVEHLLRDHDGRGRAIVADTRVWNVCGDAEINDDGDAIMQSLPVVLPSTINQADGQLAETYYESLEIHTINSPFATCGGGSGAGVPLEGEDLASEGPGIATDETCVIRDQVASDVREYARTNGRGSVPAGIILWADARATSVRVDWRRQLAALVAKTSRECQGRRDWSWKRLSRRAGPILRPGMVDYAPRIAIVVDTSGSMSNRGPEVLGIVESIVRHYGECLLIQVDAEITHRGPARKRGTEYRGGGGTDLRPALDEASSKSDLVVAITDGFTPWPDRPLRTPLVVIGAEGELPLWVSLVRL